MSRKGGTFVLVRAHLWLTGRVQGVAFRYYAAAKAKELMISGFIRNLDDGRVEVVIQGEPENVEKMIDWCRKGPPHAIVKDAIMVYEDPDPEWKNFQIRG